jgi:hypothetical protein
MHVLGSNETWGTVIADILKRGDPTVNDISILMAILAMKLKNSHSDLSNIQHQAIIDEMNSLSTLIRIHFQGY